jgi:hypothetical protein
VALPNFGVDLHKAHVVAEQAAIPFQQIGNGHSLVPLSLSAPPHKIVCGGVFII